MNGLALGVPAPYGEDRLFDPLSPLNRDDCLAPFRGLRTRLAPHGWSCHTLDLFQRESRRPTAVLFLDVPAKPVARILGSWFGKVRCHVVLQECEVVRPENWAPGAHDPFHLVFTWRDDLVDDRRYRWLNFTGTFPADGPPAPAAETRPFTMIAANKTSAHPLELYSARLAAIRWFEANHPDEFDLHGVGWDRPATDVSARGLWDKVVNRLRRMRILPLPFAGFPSYRGPVRSKSETLRRHRFAICFENARGVRGYITEKIFDCLAAGCIPLYRGAPNIAERVPSDCFVDVDAFPGLPELREHVLGMSGAAIAAMRARAADFLASPKIAPFTVPVYVQTVVDAVLADA